MLFPTSYLLVDETSTCGVLACIIACVQWHNSRSRPFHESGADSHAKNGGGNSGSVVILPRDAHKSAVHALVLSGATPCFLPPARHAGSGISLGIEAAALEAALREHGDKVRGKRQRVHGQRGGVHNRGKRIDFIR